MTERTEHPCIQAAAISRLETNENRSEKLLEELGKEVCNIRDMLISANQSLAVLMSRFDGVSDSVNDHEDRLKSVEIVVAKATFVSWLVTFATGACGAVVGALAGGITAILKIREVI